ncbi:putative HVA22-like protein g [Herrania umbratica]|uniref:HVA22-like protein n=1 Tax=Herrania umbratica TaxID=108875 RepID=A0A6J1ASW3_9ROSI|nr:putative HVA22-like protein g [Herrania umbratica]XP_021289931.1 putative HVA22-like protein g [Herrania umbratica]
MLGEFITRVLVLILGYAYPAIECFKTVEKNKVGIEELRFWCQYWIVVAFLTVFERIGDLFISWLPMYDELKLALLIYLWYPKTKGTGYVYDTLLRPFMVRHETEVDRKIQELRARAWDFALYYWQNCTELGQTKFFEMLQYLSGQSSRIKHGNQKSDQQNPPSGFFSQSGKSKNWPPTTINRAVVESPMSKLVHFQPDSQSEYDQSDDDSIPDSPRKSKHQQARFKLRRSKPHN